ncbi:MAG TPA: hypothetical protein VFT72_13195 [Opitutaceae bacterium]|nr:hypothetical protein [Opitutaceae bacterium]
MKTFNCSRGLRVAPRSFTAPRVGWFGIPFLCLSLASVLLATPPRPPGVLSLDQKEITGQLSDGRGEFSLPIDVQLESSAGPVHISAKLRRVDNAIEVKRRGEKPADETLLDQNVEAARGRATRVNVPVKVPGPGTYEIDVRLTGGTGRKSGFSDRVVRVLIVDEKGYRLITREQASKEDAQRRKQRFQEQLNRDAGHPHVRLLFSDTAPLPNELASSVKAFDVPRSRQLEVRPAGLNERVRKYVTDRSAESWSAKDPITVRGRITFLDIDGVWKPLVNVTVSLWDEDTFSDEFLGNVATDWSGNWSFSVNNDDGWFQDGRDIYYTFRLENTRWRLKDGDGDTYEWKSAVHDDLSDGSVVDFGTETAGNSNEALQVWSTLNLAWNHAVVVAGQDPGFVDCNFPTGATNYSGEVNIAGSDNDGPDSITHEYGHALMAHAYAGEGGDPSPGGSHGFGDCGQNQALSWSEGWATAFMLSARPDGTYNWHEGQPGQAIENFSSSCRTGESSEGWVAAALLDMMDSANDNNGGSEDQGRNGESDANAGSEVALATIYRDTMWGSHHNDVLQFWTSLAGELDSTRSNKAAHIMYYNWMSVLDPDACAATRIALRRMREPDEALAGLRKFRDHALRGVPQGRALINSYYRNSPEIAMILLKDQDAMAESAKIIEYFSHLGETAGNHAAYLKFSSGNDRPFVSADIEAAIEKVLRTLEERGSPELKRDLLKVRMAFDSVRGKTLEQLQEHIDEMRANAESKTPETLLPTKRNPASVKALQSAELKSDEPGVRPPTEK